jgi:pheromone shutdown protein TraB
MGLVQSQKESSQETIEVEGLLFTIEQSLTRYIPVYGQVVIDFRNNFFGQGFTVDFSRQRSC